MKVVQAVPVQEILGATARRNAAWGWTRESYKIIDLKVTKKGNVQVKLKGYKSWMDLNRLLLLLHHKKEPTPAQGRGLVGD